MPKENCKFNVLNELHELSKEADQLIELIPSISILDDYFSLVKETAQKIKNCTSVKDIEKEFPPDIKTVLRGKQQIIKNTNADKTETQRGHVHSHKNISKSEETTIAKTDNNERSSKVITAKDKNSLQEASVFTFENEVLDAKSLSAALCKNVNQESLPKVDIYETDVVKDPVKIIPENSTGLSKTLTETPIMDKTFNKLMNNTIILDVTPSNKSIQKSNIGSDKDIRITRLASKQQVQGDFDSTPSNKNILKLNIGGDSGRITRSAAKQKENSETTSSPKLTRSGSKRKSSVSKNRSSKKQKTEKIDSVSKSRQLHNNKQPLKPVSQLSSANKMKPIIMPTLKHSTSMVISKEKQIIEEIQKKEEKATKNRKKVLAERQLKVEENKKKRDEKMKKTLQKRLQMEKEKEERLEKKDIDKRSQIDAPKESAKKTKPATKTKTKELIEQHMKENNAVLPLKQNETVGHSVFKTPVRKLSDEKETYDLTPAPDSSTYDFSDDEDKPSGKPIPLWAQGVHLKLALTHQYYNPPNADEIFGTYIEPPNLSEIFGVQKKIYTKRTSSAVWHHTPPDRSFCR